MTEYKEMDEIGSTGSARLADL